MFITKGTVLSKAYELGAIGGLLASDVTWPNIPLPDRVTETLSGCEMLYEML